MSARGENQLEIRKYHRTPLETKTINCVSGAFGWTGRFDIELRDNAVHITIKIRLINRLGSKPAGGGPLPAAGPPLTNAAKRAMATDIESKLSHKNLLHRERCRRHDACDCPKSRGCCKLRLFVHVVFVEVGEHHTVDLFRGPGRANATNWTRKKTRGNSWAHETGHLLGWYDEYPGGAVGPAPRWKPNRTTAVMNVGLEVPNEYNWDFRDWLKDKVGEPWRVLKE